MRAAFRPLLATALGGAKATPIAAFLMKSSTSSCIGSSRAFCSHDDFKPKTKAPTTDTHAWIDKVVKDHPIVLFMKGTPQAPQCGFSMQAVRILNAQGAKFQSVNVLENAAVRSGIKEYSGWPTIPQLFVQGELVGGCDIMTQMHQNGDLEKLVSPVKDAKQ